MICTNCGTENLAGAKFCMECATPLAAGCPTCGFVNPPAAKFCSECATPLTTRAPTPAGRATDAQPSGPPVEAAAAERRLVSILFADLVGFTPFAEERDAEEVRETLTRYFDLARETIERYGGTVEKFIGDAVMAVWGAPTAQEDDAERAVRAALDLVAGVPSLGAAIQARAGVLTGEAAVTVGATNQGLVAGDLVNTCSRLQSVAEPGTVLVGETTQHAASESIVFEPVGEQMLKGKQAPVPAWRAMRVVAQRRGRGRSDSLEAPFVGRDDEMRLLKELFHATNREERPRLVSVIGPGGIGKSRLAWEFLKYIDGLSEGIWWHDGRSPAYGEGITFWALGEMIRERAGLLESDDEPTTRDKLAASVRQHVPDEAERTTVERSLLVLLGFESGVDPQELFGAWRRFFERLADVQPVVMVFEDLHFADPGLLDFIDHVLEWSRSSPITVITLARPELLDRRPNWGAGKRSFSSIYLEPLSDEHMRELLAGLVPGLPERALAAIIGRADGIPLYAVETVRMLVANGRLALADGVYRPTGDLGDIAVPETLTALIAARLDALNSADRSLVADASVLGQSFSPVALAALAGEDVAQLESQLAGLVQRELLRREADPRSPERGQYAFVQALIREVAYNTLSKRDRKARHLAAARYFESLATDEVAGALAVHYLAAYRAAGEGEVADALKSQARLALRGAAERAAALGSHEQAVTFLEQALEITSDTAERALLHERAHASAWEGIRTDVDLRHAEGALAARRELGDRAAIAVAVARHARTVAASMGNPTRALELLLEAWEEFGDLEQTTAGVKLTNAIAGAYSAVDRMPEALAWIERLIPIAEKLDLMEDLVQAFVRRGIALSERPREGVLMLRGAHAMALASGYREVERNARILLTFLEQWDDPVAGLELGREGLEIARRIGSSVYGFSMVGNGAVCAIRVGEWDWAGSLLEEWIPDDVTLGEAAAQFAELLVDRAVLTALRGGDPAPDIERASRRRAGMTDPQYESYEAWARAWAAFSADRFADAHKEGLRAAQTSFFNPLALPLAARASLWGGDPGGAREAVDALNRTMWRGAALALDKASIEAGLTALEGRTTEALSIYRDTLRGWRSLKLAWDEALTIVDMAKFLGPEVPEVHSAAEWARATLSRLGARPYLERLEAALTGSTAVPREHPRAVDQVQV
ncbi:MAG TPA: adenylate/guanylate cyclase domain-containing protein [Candidatus Limnocylindria bacterium]|nr:adenylate/guanylate cyclase domain-containing protein [Candidatus Limnocylindria bacterium]